ncbi:MAG TPA: hypothetical protein VIL55_10555 [Naasia sp.]|jgi:hypothetical protein
MSVQGPDFGSPSSPYGSPPPAGGGGKRPTTVEIAFWLYIATAALTLLGTIIGLTQIDAAREAALRQLEAQGQALDPAAIDGIVIVGVVIGVIIGVVFTVLWALFAIFLRRGMGWARWVLLALTILALPGLFSTNVLSIISVLLPVAATVLAFLPQSTAWYRDMRAAKLARNRTFPA